MSWNTRITGAAELRAAFAGRPDAKFRPVPLWWWSGESLDAERLRWQIDRMAELGVGAWCVTGLAPYGPAAGSVPDEPRGFSDDWLALYRAACEHARERGLKVITWSPLQISGAVEANRLAAQRPDLRGELLVDGVAQPFSLDYGNAEAVRALVGDGTDGGRYLAAIDDLLGDVIVGMFEDEFPLFPPWAPDFPERFRARTGQDVPADLLARDHGPRTPALRCALFEVATERIESAYTAWQREFVERHDLLAGFDEMTRGGAPLKSSMCYFDPFRVLSWATAPGTDQMGDARFHLSLANLYGAPRVWFEGFHSHGWGFGLADQWRMLAEWGREGASLYLPHGFYYTTQSMWWEWAPPEMGWRQPYARHYRAFADAVGRLMSVLSGGVHVPEAVVLYPTRTVWAATTAHRQWAPEAHEASETYLSLMGLHHALSAKEPDRFWHASALADAGYDRVTVDEDHLDTYADLPIVLPATRCLKTGSLRRLVEQARGGRRVVVVGAWPEWSAEEGRDDPVFLGLVDELRSHAVFAEDVKAAVALLPPPRVEGLRSLTRRVGDLDVRYLTGAGQARLRGMADRCPERWDPVTGAVEPLPALRDGDDLLVDIAGGPGTIVALPTGEAVPPIPRGPETELALPEVWDCAYLPWAENRWGDYLLPANDGDPPVQRRTFAHREGDDPAWRLAPVVPEDVEHEHVHLGFEERMHGMTGRPRPEERRLPDGWHEAVATFGPRARLAGGGCAAWSERYGVEEVVPSTHIGLRGRVEPVKVDFGQDGAGEVTSWGWVPEDAATHLVIEGGGVVDVVLDSTVLAAAVEADLVALPVSLTAGWHEVTLRARPRGVARGELDGYMAAPRTRLAWVFGAPYRREPVSIWGGLMAHPDYKGSAGPRRFRRRVALPEEATVRARAWGSAETVVDVPDRLPAGEHVIEARSGGAPGTPAFLCELEFTFPSGGTLVVTSDGRWETAAEGEDAWGAAFPVGSVFAPPPPERPADDIPYRHPLTDVAWLSGEEAVATQLRGQVWADSPEPPPPSWFAFTAPPGARALSLPVAGEVTAWVDGESVEVVDGAVPLREHARVALRVQAPAGRRGAACFADYPQLGLGDGTIRTGVSWHRQGLDTFSGVILHRAEVDLEGTALADGGEAELDLGQVAGSVGVRVNGEDAGVVFCPPWRLRVDLRPGRNVIELEVANTLGPWTSRGVPTQFSPEEQRVSGILGRARLVRRAPRPALRPGDATPSVPPT